jgi:catechol 2,3-dioxygenase-like lactoylglutathione lyase family enzyme
MRASPGQRFGSGPRAAGCLLLSCHCQSEYMRVGLDHLHIFASNVSVTIEFFCTMLGATVVWDEEAAGVRNVRLALGKAFVQVYEQAPKAPRGGPVHHLGIETDDLDALVSRMKEHGFRFRNPIREEPKFRYVMVSGPDDLLMELFQCHEPRHWGIKREGASSYGRKQSRALLR